MSNSTCLYALQNTFFQKGLEKYIKNLSARHCLKSFIKYNIHLLSFFNADDLYMKTLNESRFGS